MRKNPLKEMVAKGHRIINGWVAIPSGFSTEIYASQGFDSVTIDMQHGASDPANAVELLQAVTAAGVTPMARVPWNDAGVIQRVLDAGAYGIVCPMINTAAEAKAFVTAGRYPPIGSRSFGPFRAAQYGGADYWQHANDEVLLFAMIETVTAVSNLDAILDVKGLSGTYIGPSDLSLSMGKAPTLDPSDKDVLAAMATICAKTKAKGLIAGVHTDGAKTARKRFDEGFQLCTLLNDVRLLATATANAIKETRGEGPAAAAKTY